LPASQELKAWSVGNRAGAIRPDRRTRDILLEAVRRPHLIPEGAEMLAALAIPDPDLDSLRHALLDAFHFGDPIDVAGLRRHLLERGATSAAALLERFSTGAEGTEAVPAALSDAIDGEWMRALSIAARVSELERDAQEARAAVAQGDGAALERHRRIAAEQRRGTTQDDAPAPRRADDNQDFDELGFRENGFGDEGEI
jgi:hypothetical protein